MTPPLVSVIMIVRNGEKYLAQALESVLAQDYRPIEILVVDGRSTDATADIARSYQGVRYILQETLGISNAYNLGIECSGGDFIAFLSHDDLWTPNKLSIQVGTMRSRPEIQYTVAKALFFLESGCQCPPGFRAELIGQERTAWIMETLVARRSVFDAVGGLDPAYKTAEDVDWFARAKDAGIPMAEIDQVLLHKRVHDENVSVNAPDNTRLLLQAMKRKIERKRSSKHEKEPLQ